MKEFKGVVSNEEPISVDIISSTTTIFIRSNKVQKTITDEFGESHEVWTYDEIQYTKDEYIQLLHETVTNQQTTINNINLDLSTALLGVADVYELVLGGTTP